MHSEWGHLPNKALKTILKMSKSSKELLDAVDHPRCEHCVISAKLTQTAKVGPPKPYIFNHEVGIDVVDIHDVQGNPFQFLNIVCQGTNFQIFVYLREGIGVPKSQLCVEAFQLAWTSWAGWPRHVVTDRGLHNRGKFSRKLGSKGISIRNIALESPEQLGRTERHGDIWKALAKRVINAQRVEGEAQMKIMATELNPTVNDGMRKGGFSCSQWVLGKFPRCPGSIMDEDEFADL